MRVCCCKSEAMESRIQRYMFRMADCALIVNELDVVDWFSLFSGKEMDYCVDLFYEIVWSCFEKHVPTSFSGDGRKLPWITSELSRLKNKETKAAKRSRASEKNVLLSLDILVKRRSIACIMFKYNILSGRMNSTNLLYALALNTLQYRTHWALSPLHQLIVVTEIKKNIHLNIHFDVKWF
jgi:hypothetical protein